jgi:hypothetical protein
VDVALDNSVVSKLEGDSKLLGAFTAKVVSSGVRVVLSLPVLHETLASTNHEKAAERARVLTALAHQIGTRFVITGELRDVVETERRKASSSTPALAPAEAQKFLQALARPDLATAVAAILPDLQKRLRKPLLHANDKKAREQARALFPTAVPADLDALIGTLSTSDSFWGSPFVNVATFQGRYAQRMRDVPHRFPAALTYSVYGYLNAWGSFFGDIGYGKYAGVLRAPRAGDWVDAQIAACAAYSRFLLTEDAGQHAKVLYATKQFRLRTRPLSVLEWLNNP